MAALGLASWAKAFSSWGGYTLFAVYGLLTAVALLVGEHRLQVHGIQSLQHTGLVVPWHTGSSWARDQTRVPCIGRQIPNHWTTKDFPVYFVIDFISYSSFIFTVKLSRKYREFPYTVNIPHQNGTFSLSSINPRWHIIVTPSLQFTLEITLGVVPWDWANV